MKKGTTSSKRRKNQNTNTGKSINININISSSSSPYQSDAEMEDAESGHSSFSPSSLNASLSAAALDGLNDHPHLLGSPSKRTARKTVRRWGGFPVFLSGLTTRSTSNTALAETVTVGFGGSSSRYNTTTAAAASPPTCLWSRSILPAFFGVAFFVFLTFHERAYVRQFTAGTTIPMSSSSLQTTQTAVASVPISTAVSSSSSSLSSLDQLRLLADAIVPQQTHSGVDMAAAAPPPSSLTTTSTTTTSASIQQESPYKHTYLLKDDAICQRKKHDASNNNDTGNNTNEQHVHDETSCRIHLPDLLVRDDSCLITKKGVKSGTLPNQDRIALFQTSPHKQLLALFDGHGENGHVTARAALVDLPWRILEQTAAITRQLTGTTTITTTEAEFSADVKTLRVKSSSSPAATEQHPDEETMIKHLLNKSFVEMDRESTISQVPHSGSTAVIILQHSSKMYIASLGDSTAFCAQWHAANTTTTAAGTATILKQAVPHKPGTPSERQRIEDAGGHVWLPTPQEAAMGASSRVLIPQIPLQQQHQQPLSPQQNQEEEATMALAMSRSLGDEEGKLQGFLSAEPSIEVIDLNQFASSSTTADNNNNDDKDAKLFCVAASDGLTDHIPVQEVANRIGAVLFQDSSSSSTGGSTVIALPSSLSSPIDSTTTTQLGQVCRDLVAEATQGWAINTAGTYRDDISLVASKLVL